jgi:hypothetical protein
VVRIGALAAGEVTVLAEEAFAAGDGERHHHAVADFELLVGGADFNHFAHGLMADDVARLHLRDKAAVNMQVRAADRAGGHLDDGVLRMLDLGIGDFFAANVGFAVPGECFHVNAPE